MYIDDTRIDRVSLASRLLLYCMILPYRTTGLQLTRLWPSLCALYRSAVMMNEELDWVYYSTVQYSTVPPWCGTVVYDRLLLEFIHKLYMIP